MAFQDDIADDYLIFDGNETVSYAQQNPARPPLEDVTALRGVLTRRDLMGIGTEPSDVPFSIPVATLGDIEPKNGDKVTDSDGVVWLVISAYLATLDTRWHVVCRKTA